MLEAYWFQFSWGYCLLFGHAFHPYFLPFCVISTETIRNYGDGRRPDWQSLNSSCIEHYAFQVSIMQSQQRARVWRHCGWTAKNFEIILLFLSEIMTIAIVMTSLHDTVI